MKIDRSHDNVFFLVLAKNQRYVKEKIEELDEMNANFLIICGENVDHPSVIYREAKGKWDAINFGSQFIPEEAEVIILNDVDTKLHNIEHALNLEADLVYCAVKVIEGPQIKFYRILDPIRKRFNIAASGEAMVIRRDVFERIMPIPVCIAEDSYILFKALELGYKTDFCKKAFVTTDRTINSREEEAYKARTTFGIFQALKYSCPPPLIRVFYLLLPFIAPLLAILGKDGGTWVRGIERAVKDHITRRHYTKF